MIYGSLPGNPAAARFSRKSVVVTGGGSGIGQASAIAFAAEGARVMVADLTENASADTVMRIHEAGGNATAVAVDVADSGSVSALADRLEGTLDILVCAAGLFFAGSAEQTPEQDWRRIIDVNLTGTFLCARMAIPLMKAAGRGAIVTLSSSTGAHDAIPEAVAYVASKGGVTMLTKAMAVDHAADNIRINAIAPGPTDTPMLRGLMNEADRRAFGQTLPIKRLGTSQELADAVLYLASENASFITGCVLAVDGGQTALV